MATLAELTNYVIQVCNTEPIWETLIHTHINQACKKVAGGIFLPHETTRTAPLPLLHTIGSIDLVLSQPYNAMPNNYQRDLYFISRSTGYEIEITPSFPEFSATYTTLNKEGSIESAAFKGTNLYYQYIPASSTIDTDGICGTQTPTEAGELTINGDLSSDSVASLEIPRRVTINSTDDDSAINFVITGINRHGDTITETIAGINTTTETGTLDFQSITSIAVSGATAGAIICGVAIERLIIHYYRKPNVLTDDVDIPDCLPEEYHMPVLANYAIKEMFGMLNKFEQEAKYESKFYNAMLEFDSSLPYDSRSFFMGA